jgi:hypothetical protein
MLFAQSVKRSTMVRGAEGGEKEHAFGIREVTEGVPTGRGSLL